MPTIPVGLDEEVIAKLDSLVKLGIYKNRTEAIRAQIIEGLQKKPYITTNEHQIDQQKIDKAVQWMIENNRPLIRLKMSKTVTELIGEGRER